jgi:SagB-type dehydrogenase family enzyme
MEIKQKKWTCAHCGYTSANQFVGDICPECGLTYQMISICGTKTNKIIVITAEYRRATVKYGKRGIKYALIEAGHIGQNIFLQAQSLGLEAGIVGAFNDAELIDAMRIPSAHEPILLMPVGYPV